MDDQKLVAICRHDLRLEEDYDIARLSREVKIVQEDSSDTYARLTRKHRIKAREILSGYMLAWEYVEDLDGSGYGQRFWLCVFSESIFPLLNQTLSLETRLGSVHSLDVSQGSLNSLKQARLTLNHNPEGSRLVPMLLSGLRIRRSGVQ